MGALLGLESGYTGSIRIAGVARRFDVAGTSRSVRPDAYVTDDRKERDFCSRKDFGYNSTLGSIEKISRLGFLQARLEQQIVERQATQLAMATKRAAMPVKYLSGGNQQKVVLARALEHATEDSQFLNEPTAGIDIGAKEEIYSLLVKFASEGMAILLISSDLAETDGAFESHSGPQPEAACDSDSSGIGERRFHYRSGGNVTGAHGDHIPLAFPFSPTTEPYDPRQEPSRRSFFSQDSRNLRSCVDSRRVVRRGWASRDGGTNTVAGNSYKLLGYKRLIIDWLPFFRIQFAGACQRQRAGNRRRRYRGKIRASARFCSTSKDHWGNIYCKSSFSAKRHRNVPQDLFGRGPGRSQEAWRKGRGVHSRCVGTKTLARKHPDCGRCSMESGSPFV